MSNYDDYTGAVYPNYNVSADLGNIGQSIDFTNGGYDFSTPDYGSYSMPTYNFSTGGMDTPDYSNKFNALPDFSQYYAQPDTSQYYAPQSYQEYNPIPQIDLSNSAGGNYDNSPSSSGGGILAGLLKSFTDLPLDRQFGLGAGVISGLGSMFGSIQNNKLAKKAVKQNASLAKYREAALKRAEKNAEVADKYANSYDTTTAAKVKYDPLTADEAAHYGERGAPHQQVEVTPGVTTRNYLAEGGMPTPEEVHTMNGDPHNPLNFLGYLLHGKTLPSERMPHKEHEGLDHLREYMSNTAYGKSTGKHQKALDEIDHYANGGQADNIHAMLSEGEFVIPADVVSALGDGNTQAGASALHQMMEQVRKSARSGTIKKIPPKAKTPMSYMKKGK